MATLLLVEDNDLNRDMLSRRLERMEYHVELATNGEEAIARTHEIGPDLILMDINMPVLDGWEATRRLKQDPKTQAIPIIALTAHALTSDRDKAEEIGFNDFATKPVDFPALVQKIEDWLGRA